MDFSMPICDGPTATSNIREFMTTQGLEQPYICFITAYTRPFFQKVALQAGSDAFIIKPVFKDQFHKLLIKAGLII